MELKKGIDLIRHKISFISSMIRENRIENHILKKELDEILEAYEHDKEE